MNEGVFTLPISNPVLIFFIVLSIILLAPILLNKFRIPHIIGLIIAGIIVGPHGLNLLERDSSFEIFGQVGILYLMFLAGLEMDIFNLNRNRKPGIIFGLYTFTIPLVLGTAISHYLLHLDWATSTLLSTIFASHTLISYPIVSRYGLNRYPPATIAVAGTIFAILGALIVFAIIIGSYSGDMSVGYWIRFALSIIVYTLFIAYAYPRLIRWFFKTYADNVIQFIFVLALVFLSSFIAEFIGLQSIIGAFFAGIVLNRYIPSVSPLMNRLEFVGNALFIPYFLIGVGMLVDLGIIAKHPEMLWTALIMCIIAVGTKWLAAWLIQHTYHYSATDRRLIFGITTAKAAISLATVIIGRNYGLFDDAILNGTIIMILVTCTISSIVTERAASNTVIRLQNEENPDTSALPSTSEERILIPVANPSTIEGLINMALLMKNPKKKNPLYALYVNDDHRRNQAFASKRILEQAAKIASAADNTLVPISRYDLNVASGIIHTIKENNISEVVLGLHRKANIVDSFFGGKIETLLRETHKMILITKCVTPIAATTRIVVSVPPKAEYETGFSIWINRLSQISQQLGCRIIFYAYNSTIPQIKATIQKMHFKIRHEYQEVESWDDMLLLTNVVLDDDLFVVVSARRASVSFDTEYEKLPSFLTQYFADNNLVVLYPEQFGEAAVHTTFSDPLAQSAESSSHGLLGLRDGVETLSKWQRKWTLRARKKRENNES